MNKRILTVALVFVLALACVGCGDDAPTGGTITFYGDATLEGQEPAFEFTRDLTADEAELLYEIVQSVDEWTDNSSVDRLAYYFYGSFSLSDEPDSVYYIAFEECVLYYVNPIAEGEYYAAITSEDMQKIIELKK